jgi:hypothetical protein
MVAYAPGTVLNAAAVMLFPLKTEKYQMVVNRTTVVTRAVLRILVTRQYRAWGLVISLPTIKIVACPWLMGLVFLGLKRLKQSAVAELGKEWPTSWKQN